MLATTAAVHSGASGGAVVDAATGRLLGLVTSNAKHSSNRGSASGARGGGAAVTVLPHLNFSIPAAQLAPAVFAAQEAAAADAAAGGSPGGPAAAALQAWHELDVATAGSGEMQHIWRLDPRQQERQRQQERGGGGGFGGAPLPAKLRQLLQEMQQQQQQQPRAKL